MSVTHLGATGTGGSKTNTGRFFEDFRVGETIAHAVPRTVKMGERAIYHMLYPARHALASSDVFAQDCGLPFSPLDEMIVFHVVFGKSVPDISLNAVANLGYAEARWLAPVWPGDTLRAVSEVIGVKQTSAGTSGIVWVRTTGLNQHDEPVLSFVRWVMVKRRAPSQSAGGAPDPVVPDLDVAVAPGDLVVPHGLDFTGYDFEAAGEPWRLGDYTVGEVIDHRDGVTLEEAEHMMATRLWQNTARVHFDATARTDGRLVYGGHVISLARALSFNGLANAQIVVGINAGTHANPCGAGDTVRAYSTVLDTAVTDAPGVGAIRLRTVATRDGPDGAPVVATPDLAQKGTDLRGADGRYLPHVLLSLDYWALMPT